MAGGSSMSDAPLLAAEVGDDLLAAPTSTTANDDMDLDAPSTPPLMAPAFAPMDASGSSESGMNRVMVENVGRRADQVPRRPVDCAGRGRIRNRRRQSSSGLGQG